MTSTSQRVRRAIAALAGIAGALSTRAAAQAPTDTALARVEQRFSSMDRASARALADSLLGALKSGTPSYAAALYWRAFTSANAADAERDYLTISVEYPLSTHSADALLNLAQLEYARHDRATARRHFEQLLTEHPGGPLVAKAAYWSARLAFDDADTTHACAVLSTARAAVSRDDVELRNQIDYYSGTCADVARADSIAAKARADSIAAVAARDSAAREAAKPFTIQVASYKRKADATALAAKLKERGYDSRVVGTNPPFRVRIGHYASRDAAKATLERIKRTNPRAIIAASEPR